MFVYTCQQSQFSSEIRMFSGKTIITLFINIMNDELFIMVPVHPSFW